MFSVLSFKKKNVEKGTVDEVGKGDCLFRYARTSRGLSSQLRNSSLIVYRYSFFHFIFHVELKRYISRYNLVGHNLVGHNCRL